MSRRSNRRARHQNAENPDLGRGDPSTQSGRTGEQQFRNIPGEGLTHLVKTDLGWQKMSTSQGGTSKGDFVSKPTGGLFGGAGGPGGGTGGGITSHPMLMDLTDTDDHTQYVHNTVARTVSASHTFTGIPAFNGGISGTSAPFSVDSTDVVTNLNADRVDGKSPGTSAADIAYYDGNTRVVDSDKWDGYQFSDYLDQAVKIASTPTFGDLTLSSPSSIYLLSHDSFADFLDDEHIDWTDTTENFLTTGTVGGGFITATTTDNTKLRLAEDSSNYVDFLVNDTGQLTITPSGNSVMLKNESNLGSVSYVSGFAGAGWQLSRDSLNEYSAEFDNLIVRGTMSVYELLIQQIRATNGSLIIGSADKVSDVSNISGDTYLFTVESDEDSEGDGGTDFIHFKDDDLILAQKWTGGSGSTGELTEYIKRVRATVIENTNTIQTTESTCNITDASTTVGHDVNASIVVGLRVGGVGIPADSRVDTITSSIEFEMTKAATATTDPIDLTFYSTLTAKEFKATLVSGDTVETGDMPLDFVRIGSTSDEDRQGGIYLTSEDSGAPFIDIFDDVDSWADWRLPAKTKARLGRLDGINYDDGSGAGFDIPDTYGLFSNDVYLTGKITATSGFIGDNDTGWMIDANGFTNVGTTTATRIGVGTGGYGSSTQGFWVDGSGRLSLGDALTWTGSALAIKGSIQLTDGTPITSSGLNWRGNYDNSTAYAVNDGVGNNGVSYICTAVTTGNEPPNATYWDVMAAQGGQGQQGDQGNPGAAGDSVDIVFIKNATQPSTPAASSSPPDGWSSDVDNAPGSGVLWSCVGYQTNSTGDYTWETPIQVEGSTGAEGLSVAEVSIFQRSSTTLSTPTEASSYNFSTSVLTPPDGTSWTAAVPAGTDPCYISRAVAASTSANGDRKSVV